MLVGILLAIGIILAIFLANNLLENKNLVETFVVGTCLYFVIHALTSFCLFLFDTYSIQRNAVITLTVTAIITGFALIKNRVFKFNISKTKEFIIPLIVALLLLPFVSIKNEYYGMGQDEGVYQTQALAFLDGDTRAIKDFPGYYDHSDFNEDLFNLKADNVSGLDTNKNEYIETRKTESTQVPSGYFHGIPVFSAFMATWAQIYGFSHMQDIQSVFFVLLLLLTYMCASNLGLKYYLRILSEIAVGFCPLIIWVGKSSLTELFLGVMIALFLYFITSDNEKIQCCSIIPVIIFSIYHISFYTKAPVFIGIYGMLYFIYRRKSYAFLLLSVPVIWILSLWASLFIQPVYTTNNYLFLFGKYAEKIPAKTLPYIVTIIAGVLLMAELIFLFVIKKMRKKVTLETLSKSKIFTNSLRILLILPLLKIAANIYLNRNKEQDVFSAIMVQVKIQTIVRFMLASGAILFIIAVLIALVCPRKLIKTNATMILSIMFFYCIIINAAFLSPTVDMLYYWGRYLVPFIAVSALFVMTMVKDINKWFVVAAFTVSICINIPANLFLINHLDDTKLNWDILSDISELTTNEDTIIIADDSELVMWMGIRYTSDAAVYPQLGDMPSQADDILKTSGGNAYIVSSSELNYDYADLELVYSNNTTFVPDNSKPYSSRFSYPITFNEETRTVYVYKCAPLVSGPLDYTIESFYENYSGLGFKENGYSWSCESDVDLNCYLIKDSYTAQVDFYGGIPYVSATGEPYTIDISINGTYVETVTISLEENFDGFSFDVDEDYLNNGRNTITFSSKLWNGSIINPDETRMFGYPLQGISFCAK